MVCVSDSDSCIEKAMVESCFCGCAEAWDGLGSIESKLGCGSAWSSSRLAVSLLLAQIVSEICYGIPAVANKLRFRLGAVEFISVNVG